MEWYYEKLGKQAGPVSEDQLRQMRATGEVQNTTLVWRAGMPKWQPYDTMLATSGPPPVPGLDGLQHKCCECGQVFPKEEMISYQNLWVCASCKPIFFQRVREGGAGTGSFSNVWRYGKTLVMSRDATLPDRCIKCNQPANGYQLKRKLSWHSPGYYFIVLLNVIIYAIVAAVVSKKATIHIGLCEIHQKKRKTGIIITWSLILGSIGLFILAGVIDSGVPALIGIFTLLGGIIYGAGFVPPIKPVKIDAENVRIQGVCREYLEQFPEWTGGK